MEKYGLQRNDQPLLLEHGFTMEEVDKIDHDRRLQEVTEFVQVRIKVSSACGIFGNGRVVVADCRTLA